MYTYILPFAVLDIQFGVIQKELVGVLEGDVSGFGIRKV